MGLAIPGMCWRRKEPGRAQASISEISLMIMLRRGEVEQSLCMESNVARLSDLTCICTALSESVGHQSLSAVSTASASHNVLWLDVPLSALYLCVSSSEIGE